MKRRVALCLAVSSVVLLSASYSAQTSAGESPDPAATVKAFYTFHFQRKCDFSLASLRLEHKWLDESLYSLLVAALKKPAKPDEVPDLEGDPFTNSQDRLSGRRFKAGREERVCSSLLFLENEGQNN